eukprot:6359358-Prymnesium_polylepis.1
MIYALGCAVYRRFRAFPSLGRGGHFRSLSTETRSLSLTSSPRVRRGARVVWAWAVGPGAVAPAGTPRANARQRAARGRWDGPHGRAERDHGDESAHVGRGASCLVPRRAHARRTDRGGREP